MEFKHSVLIDPSTYDDMGLCGGISVRVHKDYQLDREAISRARQDYEKFTGLSAGKQQGAIGTKYAFASLAMPEVLPDRLETVSYLCEFGFLWDDDSEAMTDEELKYSCNESIGTIGTTIQSKRLQSVKCGKQQLQAKGMLLMVAKDHERGLKAAKGISQWAQSVSETISERDMSTIDKFLHWRTIDAAGPTLATALLVWGMALTIPDTESRRCDELLFPAYKVIAIHNDLMSYENEISNCGEGEPIRNVLWFLTKSHSITLDEAKKVCKGLVEESISEYFRGLDEARRDTSLSLDTIKVVEALQYIISGNLYWSLDCPRYHASSSVPRFVNGKSNDNGKSAYAACVQTKLTRNDRPENSASNVSSFPSMTSTRQDPGNSALFGGLSGLGDELVLAPFRYLSSLRGSGYRDKMIEVFNLWLNVPEENLKAVKCAVNYAHSSSLMFDDIEDSSPLRRGQASTHSVFGTAQTINTATYLIIAVFDEFAKRSLTKCLDICIKEMMELCIGQSFDLHWANNIECPSVEEYFKSVESKTGSLFAFLAKLMVALSPVHVEIDLTQFIRHFSRFFQIRDDLKNLVAADYTERKGFCEDLDEGKFSFPLIHAMHNASQQDVLALRNILVQRRASGHMTFEQKKFVLGIMQRTGSLEHTKTTLKALQKEINSEIAQLEKVFGMENYPLRLLLHMLQA